MTLGEYLSEASITPSAFAAKIGVSAAAAHRYAQCERIPRPEIMRRIVHVTDGKVSASDFYSAHERRAPANPVEAA